MMNRIYCFILWSLSVSFSLSAQSLSYADIDSLLQVYYYRGDYQTAANFAQQGAEKARKERGDRDSLYAEYLGHRGFFLYQLTDYTAAEVCFVTAKNIKQQQLGEAHPAYWESLNSLASLYQKIENYNQAEVLYQQIIALEQRYPRYEGYDYTLSRNNLSTLYRDKGAFEQSEKMLLDALKKLPKDASGAMMASEQAAMVLNNLAITYDKMGRYEQAEPLFREVLRLWEQFVGKQHPEYAATLNNLAALYYHNQEYEKAEALYLQVIQIDRKTLGETHPNNANNLNNLAELYRKIGRNADAKRLYQEANALWASTLGTAHPSYAMGLNNLALLEMAMGNYANAEAHFLQSKQLWEQKIGSEQPAYGNTLNNLALLYEKEQRYALAEKHYQQALAVRQQYLGTAHPDYLKTLNLLASLYQKTARQNEALPLVYSAIVFNSKKKDLDTTQLETQLDKLIEYDFHSNAEWIASLQVLYAIYESHYQQQKNPHYLKKAYHVLQIAIQSNERLRHRFSEEKDKLRVLEQMSSLVYQAIHSGLLLVEDTQEKAYLAELFQYAEQNKSILLADAVKGNRAQILGDLPDSLALREQDLQRQKDILKKKRYEAKSDSTKAKLAAREQALDEEIDRFMESLQGRYPQYHQLKYANITATVADIQTLLDKESLFLEYFVYDSLSYLFAIAKETFAIYPIPIAKDSLGHQIKRLRRVLTGYELLQKEPEAVYRDYTTTAHWFYQYYVAPALTPQSGIRKLIFIADGELGHLPFETFLTAAAPATPSSYADLPYLLRDYAVSYHYSATLWKAHVEQAVKPHNQRMLACAARYGDALDSNLIHLRGAYMAEMRHQLLPLPAAQEEVRGLSQQFAGDFFFNDDVNERFFKENAQQYGIIHLAMHGLLHRRTPILSSLAFSENRDSLNDNFLQGYEIAHLKLNADLVVLSACETGYGNFEQGEGIVSIARSFMYAGVPSLVVSLWQVNDKSTSLLMESFYAYLAQGKSKDEALRQAKLDYISKSDDLAAHPAFWSPFIQLGDSRAIAVQKRGLGVGIWLAIGGLGLLLGGWWYKRNWKRIEK